jgi:glycosyltransferase involved in cell wall biosynthesis
VASKQRLPNLCASLRESLIDELAVTVLVSIIVPAYNAERFITRTLRSALNQTFKDIEVVVVDDGSTDNTRSIVERVAELDSRVRLFSTINRGVAKARNFGIENARGTLVGFLDADDLWHPTKIARQVEALNVHLSDPSWAGVYVLSRIIDEEDRVIGSVPMTINCRGYMLSRNLVLRFVGNGSNLLVRKEAALAVGGFDPLYADAGLGGCEDLDFELKLAAQYRMEAVRSFLVGYRSYEGNMSSDRLRMAKSLVSTIAQHIKRNPCISPQIRRWGLGSCYRRAFILLLSAWQPRLAMSAFCMMLLNDPILSIDVAAKELPLIAMRKLKRFLPNASKICRTARVFMSVDPDGDLDAPIPVIARLRERQLIAGDRKLEEKKLGARVHIVN